MALSSLEKIVHPSAPPLGSTLEYEPLHGVISDKEMEIDSSQANVSNSSHQSINDIPLSAFPNLNNVIVVKVVQSDSSKSDDGVDSTGMHSPSVQSIHQTTINMSDNNSSSQNYQNFGDIIKSQSGVNDEVLVKLSFNNTSNIESNNVVNGRHYDNDDDANDDTVEAEADDNDASLFSKINASTDTTQNKSIVNRNSVTEHVKNESITQKVISSNGIIEKPTVKLNTRNGLSPRNEEEPRVKRIKILEKEDEVTENEDNKEIPVTNHLNNVGNGETNNFNEEDMMNCFVDAVQD